MTVDSTSYFYDGDGACIAKNSGTLYWGQGLAKSDATGNITSEYIFMNGKRLARRDLATGATSYYLSDHLGSSNLVTDATGNIQNESDFYPYGGENSLSNNLANHYKFTGKERDAESGLDYFGARYYASSMGRWMSPDWADKPEAVPYSSLDDPQSLNLYAYVGNNPNTGIDLDGHFGIDVAAEEQRLLAEIAVGEGQWTADLRTSGQLGIGQQTEQQQNSVSQQGQASKTDAAGHPIDKDAIANYADQHAEKGSLGKCAAYCRRAFVAGGVDTSGYPIDAKDWGPTLVKNGAGVVSQDGYSPQKADTAVFAGSGAHPHGHIAVYDGKQWVSDFKQRNISPYRTGAPPVTIYRFRDN